MKLSLAVLGAVSTLAALLVPATAHAAPPSPLFAPARTVRVHVRTPNNDDTARVAIRRSDGTYDFVCRTPPACVADVPPGSELRITLNRDGTERSTFMVPDDPGGEVDLEVLPAPSWPLAVGIPMIVIGGVTGLLGFVTSSGLWGSGGNPSVGVPIATGGAAVATGGILWLALRSQEPRVMVDPRPGAPESYGRNDTLVGDVGSAKSREASPPVPAPFTPLSYDFPF